MSASPSAVNAELAPADQERQRRQAKRLKREAWTSRSLLLPALIFSILLTQIPFLTTIYYSTQRWELLYPKDRGFAGLDNFKAVFSSGALWPSLRATVFITVGSVLGALVLGMIFALLLDRKFPGRALARTLMITPFLIMPAAAALIWKYSMFDTNIGILNWLMRSFGFDVISWGTDHPMASIIIVLIWQFTPFFMLILLAGLQGQSQEVLEAARVDGAGPWRIFTWITLPHLRVYAEIAALLGTVIILQIFDPVQILTKGTGGTKTLPFLLYERGFIALNVGEAAAFGVVSVVLTLLVATIALRTLFRVFMEGGQK